MPTEYFMRSPPTLPTRKGAGHLYTFKRFDSASNRALNGAIRLAGELGHEQVGTEHLLLCLVCGHRKKQQESGVPEERLRDYLVRRFGRGDARRLGPENFNRELTAVLESCGQKKAPRRRVTDAQLLAQLLEPQTEAARMAGELQLTFLGGNAPQALLSEPKSAPLPRGRGLERYGKNLTQMARQNQLDPCIGREAETARLLQILCRRQKNNPCLVGEPGVGKTAVVEGLAQLIAQDAVPAPLRDKQIFSLDIASVVAGTKYRGDFEERLRGILEEASAGRGVILFIDEVHTIIGAGAAEGAVDAANILKPVLARGGLQLIGATTTTEYHRHIEKDAALERRFQQVPVEEPDREKTLQILQGLRPRYEEFHRMKISDEALDAAVDLSIRYIHDRFLPDKAVDLLDEAASACVAQECSRRARTAVLGVQPVLQTAARWVGMPVEQLTRSDRQRLLELENCLQEGVIGQQRATAAVAAAVRRFRMGFSEDGRPNGSFLFLGPTGVGKSLLARILARQLFGSEKLLFRFDMSEYNEPHSVSRLIGASPGYVGYERSGLLTGAVHRHPYCIVLFDELEKAHPEVLRLLLQILEEGELTDNDGRRVDFRHTLVLATSNLGSRQDGWAAAQVGFARTENPDRVPPQVRQFLTPELVNRFDEIVTFDRLDRPALEKIARQQLQQLAARLRAQSIELEFTAQSCRTLVEQCWQPEYGARPLRRGIKTYVEDPLCMELLQSPPQAVSHVVLDGGENGLQLAFRQPVCTG